MQKIIAISFAVLLIFSMSVPAFAHDGWSQTNTPIIEAGEVSYVELLFGNHSNEHGSYRIEGSWNPKTMKVYVTSPSGEKTDVSKTLFYTGEMIENSERSGVNNYHVASFSSSTPGAYIISVEGDQIFAHGGVASRTLRSAKSFVAVSEIPSIAQVKGMTGFDKPVSPDRAELIPLFNPVAVTTGQDVSIQLLLKGKPLAGTEVTVVRRSTSEAERFTTDANGTITWTTGPADYYLVRAKPSTDEKEEGKYESTNYESTMTFTVQNGKALQAAGDQAAVTASVGADNSAFGKEQTESTPNPYKYVSAILAVALVGSFIYGFRKKNS